MHNSRHAKIAGIEGFMYYFDHYAAFILQEPSDSVEIIYTWREV